MVAVGAMEDDVCVGGLGSEQLGAVKGAIYKTNLGVLCCDLGSFVAIANECSDLKIRIGV
jgi:hypothetical protein